MSFPDRSFSPKSEALPALRGFAQRAKATPKATVRIIAIIPAAAASEEGVVLADARVSQIDKYSQQARHRCKPLVQ